MFVHHLDGAGTGISGKLRNKFCIRFSVEILCLFTFRSFRLVTVLSVGSRILTSEPWPKCWSARSPVSDKKLNIERKDWTSGEERQSPTLNTEYGYFSSTKICEGGSTDWDIFNMYAPVRLVSETVARFV